MAASVKESLRRPAGHRRVPSRPAGQPAGGPQPTAGHRPSVRIKSRILAWGRALPGRKPRTAQRCGGALHSEGRKSPGGRRSRLVAPGGSPCLLFVFGMFLSVYQGAACRSGCVVEELAGRRRRPKAGSALANVKAVRRQGSSERVGVLVVDVVNWPG